jgi:hypothetical protein
MVIDAGEPEILERLRPKRLEQLFARRVDRQLSARDAFEQIVQLFV